MHSSLTFHDGTSLFFGDSWETSPVKPGNNCTIHLVVDSEKEVYDIFNKLSEDGEVIMPAEKTFWNSVYGNLTDKFGIQWGIEFAIE